MSLLKTNCGNQYSPDCSRRVLVQGVRGLGSESKREIIHRAACKLPHQVSICSALSSSNLLEHGVRWIAPVPLYVAAAFSIIKAAVEPWLTRVRPRVCGLGLESKRNCEVATGIALHGNRC